jgi:hypothetical protein
LSKSLQSQHTEKIVLKNLPTLKKNKKRRHTSRHRKVAKMKEELNTDNGLLALKKEHQAVTAP